MKKKFTFLMAALMLLTIIGLPGKAVGQEKSNLELTFSLTSNPGGWPTTNSTTLTNYTYTLNNVDYIFALKNVKCNSGYLMFTSTAVLGMPQLAGYKLVKVVAHSSSSCSTTTRVGISSSSSSASYISGGAYQTWSTQNHDYTYNLTGTSVNTMYYLYVTYKNAQVTSLTLTYEPSKVATPTFSPAAGSYSSTQSVTISSTTGATIYYTTDGTTPSTSSSVYSSAISVSESMTIKAFATKSGLTDSDVATATYTIVPAQKLYITSAHGTVAVTANSASVSITEDGYYSIPQSASVTLSVTPSSGYAHTGWTVTEGSVTITNNSFTMPSSTLRLTANYEAVDVDEITHNEVNEAINSMSNGYQSWSGVTLNTAVYAGCSNNSNNNDLEYIQLRNQTPAGIVTTTSGGYAKKVSVTFVNSTSTGRTITVYGKNTAYSGPSDLYSDDEDVKGTSLGTIECGTNTEITITGDYQYIGLRANGALYVEPITITWQPLTFYTVTYTPSYYVSETQVGAVTVSKTSAIAGETINLTATGMNHYHFNGWTVTDANSSSVAVTGTTSASFTMPTSNVTVVAAWEEDTKYNIEVDEDSENYILVGDKSYAAETVLVQITDVPSGKFIDEVTVAKNGGGNVDDVTYTGQEGDNYNYTFTMPDDAVTISVTFKDPETYTVSYYVKGSVDNSENYTEGNSVTLPTATTTVDITGFTLLGWSETEGGTTTLPAGTYYPSGDVSLYAVLGVVSSSSLKITSSTKNFPSSYSSLAEYTLEGKKFKIEQVYKTGSKLQFKNNAGYIYNNEDFGKIKSVVIAYYTGDDSGSNQTRNFSVKAGTSANPSNAITGTTTGDVVTFDLSGSNYTYFVLAKGSGAGYLSYIIINYEESASVSTVTEYTANDASRSKDIEASECVIVKGTGILAFTGTNKGNAANIIIEDGGQLKVSSGVQATFKKTISQSTKGSAWNTISSPVGSVGITSVTNLVNGTGLEYNLYRYNETVASSQWEAYNPANHADFTTLEKGRGYLYRNNGKEIAFAGEVNSTSASVTLTASETALSKLKGFNLIGNPFGENITMSNISGATLSGGYVITNAGAWSADPVATIQPCQGFLVQVEEPTNITITKPASKGTTYNREYIKFIVANSQYEDAAFALFEKGYGLNKINHRNADIPMLYINKDNRDLAIATMSDDTKSFNLNFKAMTMGQYTLSYKATGEYSYLHVIDRFTGEDVDMLLEGEYKFVATPNDNEARFIVKLGYMPDYSDVENDIFAYQNGSEILVSGEGELQIFDVTGRNVMTTMINGAESINIPTQGVYIFRLVGNEIKTQKIVVR